MCTRGTRVNSIRPSAALVVGTPVDALNFDAVLSRIHGWAADRESRYVCLCNVHSCVTAHSDRDFQHALHHADLTMPDGAPVAWMLRRMGCVGQERISGPDLMLMYCDQAAKRGERIYLYGGSPAVLTALCQALSARFPGLIIAGAHSPPFRPQTTAEDALIVREINDSGAATVWVGLGCPKQEKWMADHRGRIDAVMLGVGAAFDFHAGSRQRAPMWMRDAGLEWLHRLLSEPRRLWKRYLIGNTVFVMLAAGQLLSRAISPHVRGMSHGTSKRATRRAPEEPVVPSFSSPGGRHMSAMANLRQPETEVERAPVAAARRDMFHAFCDLLERNSIAYVIVAGYEDYPEKIRSDVDFLVSEVDFERLPRLFASPNCIPNARLVQALRHETTCCYYVFARQVGATIAYLHPDAAAGYRAYRRLWLDAGDVLTGRRRSSGGFWIPSPAREFEYYLLKRLSVKAIVDAESVARLARAFTEDVSGCTAAVERWLPGDAATAVAHAIRHRDVPWLTRESGRLSGLMRIAASRETALVRLRMQLSEARRVVTRVSRPTGLIIAVLGPDGSGKTTLLRHVEREFAPAFRRVRRFHLRPHFGRTGNGATVSDPHGQPPRSWATSLLKTAMFLTDYGIGWAWIIAPAKVRSTLILFDRYYHDLIMDPVRYRLPLHFPVRWSTFCVPKPDIWLVLDASARTLVQRKHELNMASAEALVNRYRKFAAITPGATLINTDQPLDATLREACDAVQSVLTRRARALAVRA